MSSPLSREMALRIGLAANALPDTIDARTLISVLDEAIGLPMTAEAMASLGMKTFRKAGGETFLKVAPDDLKFALRILKGEEESGESGKPRLDSYEEGEMPGSIRVACASNGGEDLDGHFGSCKRFLIYQVSARDLRLVDIRSTEQPEDVEDKNKWRAQLISDCDLLNVVSIGGPAAAKVVRANIHPIKHPKGGDARAVLESLMGVLQTAPPPWLARVMGQEARSLAAFAESAEE